MYVYNNDINISGTVGIGLDGDENVGLKYAWILNNNISNTGSRGLGEGIAVSGRYICIANNSVYNAGAHGILLFLNHTGTQYHWVDSNTSDYNQAGEGNGIMVKFSGNARFDVKTFMTILLLIPNIMLIK